MAPRLLSHQQSDTIKDDVYACGMMLFIMVSAIPPCLMAKSDDPYYKYISF